MYGANLTNFGYGPALFQQKADPIDLYRLASDSSGSAQVDAYQIATSSRIGHMQAALLYVVQTRSPNVKQCLQPLAGLLNPQPPSKELLLAQQKVWKWRSEHGESMSEEQACLIIEEVWQSYCQLPTVHASLATAKPSLAQQCYGFMKDWQVAANHFSSQVDPVNNPYAVHRQAVA